jgi:hypothetical protein
MGGLLGVRTSGRGEDERRDHCRGECDQSTSYAYANGIMKPIKIV